jgi:uncharacterized coiled-coil protein SlyX
MASTQPPSKTLQRILAGQNEIRAELEVVRVAQDHLVATLTRLTETWTAMFRQLGAQLDLLSERVGTRHETLTARVALLEHRLTILEGARPEPTPNES